MTIYDGRWQLILSEQSQATVELANVTALVEKVTRYFPGGNVPSIARRSVFSEREKQAKAKESVCLSLSDF